MLTRLVTGGQNSGLLYVYINIILFVGSCSMCPSRYASSLWFRSSRRKLYRCCWNSSPRSLWTILCDVYNRHLIVESVQCSTFSSDFTFRIQIRFVTNQHPHHTFISMLTDVFHLYWLKMYHQANPEHHRTIWYRWYRRQLWYHVPPCSNSPWCSYTSPTQPYPISIFVPQCSVPITSHSFDWFRMYGSWNPLQW